MNFKHLLVIILGSFYSTSLSWGTEVSLFEDQSQTPSASPTVSLASQQDLLAMLPDDCLNSVLSYMPAHMIFRIGLSDKTVAKRVKENTTALRFDYGSRFPKNTLPKGISSFTKLRILSLPDAGLTDLPPQLSVFKNLTTLNVSWNQFNAGHLPEAILTLTQLETLNVAGCRLAGLPAGLGNLTCLKELNVSYNTFKDGRLPEVITSLPQLETLRLDSCDFTDLHNEFSKFTGLKELDISKNSFHEGHLPNVILSLKDLKN